MPENRRVPLSRECLHLASARYSASPFEEAPHVANESTWYSRSNKLARARIVQRIMKSKKGDLQPITITILTFSSQRKLSPPSSPIKTIQNFHFTLLLQNQAQVFTRCTLLVQFFSEKNNLMVVFQLILCRLSASFAWRILVLIKTPESLAPC
jgi:hypothetical protein